MIRPHDVLNEWARQKGLLIHREDTQPFRAYYYISQQDCTFQVVVEPEINGTIRIDAHLIEGLDGISEHYVVIMSSDCLRAALDIIQGLIDQWFAEGR